MRFEWPFPLRDHFYDARRFSVESFTIIAPMATAGGPSYRARVDIANPPGDLGSAMQARVEKIGYCRAAGHLASPDHHDCYDDRCDFRRRLKCGDAPRCAGGGDVSTPTRGISI